MKYDNRKQLNIKLDIERDKDIIEKLESIDNVRGYMKNLIRDGMTIMLSDIEMAERFFG